MKTKNFILFILFPALAIGQNKEFAVTGKITGLANGAVVKIINGNDKSNLSQATVANGTFLLKGSVPEPGLYALSLPGNSTPFQFYLENGKISITGDAKDISKLNVSGSSSDKDFRDFKVVFDPLVGQQNSLASTINSMQAGADRDALLKTYYDLQAKIQKQIDSYIATRKKSFVSPFVLYVTAQFYDDILLLDQRFNSLDASVRNSQLGISLSQYITYNKVGAIGTNIVDFTQPDTSGAPVALSSLKGKYVLVDFWASWCRPCRMENPNVVANYNKFKDKNFTVFSVSLDRPGDKDKWLDAIHNDKLTWTHVSDLQFWNNAAAALYHIQEIPQNMLVDPNGKIIGKNLRGPELNAKLCEILGCN